MTDPELKALVERIMVRACELCGEESERRRLAGMVFLQAMDTNLAAVSPELLLAFSELVPALTAPPAPLPDPEPHCEPGDALRP